MLKSLILTKILFLALVFCAWGQEAETEKKFGLKFTGFVKNDLILDTRQTVTARELHLLLYPRNVKLDKDGKDINARPSFNYLSIQTRLGVKATGPDVFGAKTSALVEGAFFGQADSDVNDFRLRHAMMKLNWKTTELMLGQYWHVFFVTDCFPGTISFNTGIPFQFFSRQPQVRITQKIGKWSLAGAVSSQRDFTSPGGSESLRNAVLPDLQGQLTYGNKKKVLLGLTAGYKQLVPRLQTDQGFKTNETVKGFSAQAFARIVTRPLTFKAQGAYIQNGYDGLMIGGYAVQSVTNAEKNFVNYTALNNFSIWTDIHTNDPVWQVGLFGAYCQNLGSLNEIDDLENIGQYARGYNTSAQEYIGYLYRLSPRVIFNAGKARFAFEYEHSGAGYGDSVNSFGVPQNNELVINHRFLVGTYYFF